MGSCHLYDSLTPIRVLLTRRCKVTAVWIWIWLAIIVVSLAVQFVLGRRLWRAVRGLNAELRSLGVTASHIALELSRIGAAPATGALSPRHGMNLATRA